MESESVSLLSWPLIEERDLHFFILRCSVVGSLGYSVYIADGFWRPRGEDEECAVLAGMETGGFGLPIAGDGFFLDMD